MADINNLKDKIRSTIYPNGKGAIQAAAHQELLLGMADNIIDTDAKVTELSAEMPEIAKSVQVVHSVAKEGGLILLTRSEYLKENQYIDFSRGVIDYYNGWNMYIIPVESGEVYSYKPHSANANYALFYFDSSMQAVKSYGAPLSSSAIQAIGGEAFPSVDGYGNMQFAIPTGVSFVAFNKDVGSVTSPIFIKGIGIYNENLPIATINDCELIAKNGVTKQQEGIINLVASNIKQKSEKALYWEPLHPTPAAVIVGNPDTIYTFLTPNREKVGKLGSLVFSASATKDYNLGYAIFKKNIVDGQVQNLSIVRQGSISVKAGQSVIDFSSLNIIMETDYLFGFDMSKSINAVKYSDWKDGYEWWTKDGKAYPNNLYVDVNYTILYDILEVEEQFNPFENKNVAVLGDSITWLGGDNCEGLEVPSKGWTTYFKQKAKPLSIKSYARSGATWSHTASTAYDEVENTGSISDNNVIYNQINRLVRSVNLGGAEPDIIIIAAGTNDAWYPSARPNATSISAKEAFANTDNYILSTDISKLTSIAEALRFDVELLRSNFPETQIILLSPLQSVSFSLERCREVGDIIEDCAGYLSCVCIRQDKECGVYRATEKVGNFFTYDGTHTSAIGAKSIGYYLYRRVMGLMRDNIDL